MKALCCIGFDRKIEYIDTGDKIVEYPLGTALLTFLTTDFDRYLGQLMNENGRFTGSNIAEALKADFGDIHPFLESVLLPITFEADPLVWLERKLETLKKLQSDLAHVVDAVLLMDARKNTPLQRLCMLQRQEALLAARFTSLSDVMRVERRVYVNGRVFEPILSHGQEIPPPKTVTSHLLVGSDDLQAVLLTELQEMAAQNIKLKKCAYCGGYFQPFSIRTVYCDRLVGETGKTCKELAAKEKYEKKIAADEGLSLYQRRNKAYAMRVSRTPEVYQDAGYQSWKAASEAALKRYVDGEITLEILDHLTKLPEKK
ncbi:DUF6076 domain-containing protein [Oscillibacter ruminantium]|uniref:DUF6076 domain-containing protein n=1 Tax=Oscillibacter ruminantium TaxID=1263547 RepID=UPI0033174230